MARRRSRTSATGGNMDSMLDTLTNVVGILIIVLVTVQLSSQEAASRIAAAIEQLSPEEIGRIERDAAEAKAAADGFQAALDRLAERPRSDPAAEAAGLEAVATKAEAAARDAAARATALEKRKQEQSAAARRAADEAARTAAETLARAKTEAEAAERTRLALVAELDATRAPTAPPAQQVRLPDPRPAPANAKELRVICREGRVWPVDVDDLQEQAQKRAAFVVRQKKLDPDGDGWLTDGTTFVDAFNDSPLRKDDFEMTLALAGQWPQLVLTRMRGSGEPADKTGRTGSELARLLRKYDPAERFIRFFVWPDGFEGYLAARQAAAEAGYTAGWELVTSPAEHRISLGRYSIGKKPPPTPPGQKKPPPTVIVD